MKKIILGLLLLILLAGLIGGGIFIYKYRPSDEVISFSDEMYLMVEDVLIEDGEPVLLLDDILHFSFETIKTYFDEDIYYDAVEETLVLTNRKSVKRFKVDRYEASINSKEYLIDHPVRLIYDKIYIPVDLFEDDYEIEVNYFPDTNAVVVDYTDIYYLSGEIILEGSSIRSDLDIKAPILINELEIGRRIYIYGEYENWYKVRTMDGIPGFIEKKYVKVNHTKDIYKTKLLDREEPIVDIEGKINLTWDYTYRKLSNVDNIQVIEGVNIISPTWFSITDSDGTIYDKGNREYVSQYKNLAYEIWPLIDNSFNPDLTHDLLKSSKSREALIDDILDIYLDYGFQGINIDFENIYLADKDLLTQFLRELYPIFKEHDLIVSMAVTGISMSENWSMSYDRERLTEATDYLMLMAYDQHWATSPIAGSVAQYTWVESSLQDVLELIPNERLILAVPYYTRLWVEEAGNMTSQALSMEGANNFIKANNIDLEWDDISKQYYAELEKDDKIYRIWLEDNNSLKYKASLINKYDLAGIASWRKGFETEDVWETIASVVN
ncbi:MAG TPA: glycosyl hydrolase family 18 protein [Tissierellaceae bacterium]|nr:glycosyl hydrolase family 18 protein [Tissierellaceae bacterium]